MSKNLIIVIIIISLFFMGLIGGGFYIILTKMAPVQNVSVEQESQDTDKETEGDKEIGALFPLDTFIVNLSDKAERRYLRVSMTLELINNEEVEKLEGRMPQIKDTILTILPTRKFEDIQDVEGKFTLRDELVIKINELFSSNVIKKIYFTEFVVQ